MKEKNIVFKKLNLKNALKTTNAAFDIIDSERERLSRWFWWMSSTITPNNRKFNKFMLLYLLATKRKQLSHKFNNSKLYDEQFLVFVDDKFGGMVGLDNIDDIKKEAEVWYFVSQLNEGHGVASASIQFIEDYVLNNKNTERLYAKIETKNTRSIGLVSRNGYTPEPQNNKYAAVIYSKQLQK